MVIRLIRVVEDLVETGVVVVHGGDKECLVKDNVSAGGAAQTQGDRNIQGG